MIKAVIFDFGGVVHGLGKEKLSELLASKLNREVEGLRKQVVPLVMSMSVGQITEDKFWEELGGKADEVWMEQSLKCSLNLPIIKLVHDLKVRGITTVVLSNTIPPHVQIVRKFGWYNEFDKVFLSCEIGLRKPDPKAYEYALDKLGILGSECIFIDDVPENLVPAEKLGMKTVLATDPKQVVADVESLLAVYSTNLGLQS
jgi:putative hydrolase of the HAD superfamily